MSIFKKLFTPVQSVGIRLNIDKDDISLMKEAGQKNLEKIEKYLNTATDILDRRVLLIYEKKFMDKFKKIGNLHQKCPYCTHEYKSSVLGEKKCLSCKKTFLVQKRVQDMGTVAFIMEKKPLFDVQWKAVNKIKKFKYFLSREYTYISKALTKQGRKHIHQNDIMHNILSAYSKNSLNAGHFQLYSAMLFHKAELLRTEQRFAQSLQYYFYVHFLHTNGVNNKAEFHANNTMNPELRERIATLLSLGNIQVSKSKEFFDYAIKSLNAFHPETMALNMHKSYSLLLKEFKLEDETKKGNKPMRSFVLYKKTTEVA